MWPHDGKDEGLEGPARVLVARQRHQDGDADLLGEVLDEVPGVARQPVEPGAAVPQGQRVNPREQVVRGLRVAFDRESDERADLPLPGRHGGTHGLVVAHHSMVPRRLGVRGTASVVVHRSVMSRCAGTHLPRPPLPLDRLVPEELHISRMRHSAGK